MNYWFTAMQLAGQIAQIMSDESKKRVSPKPDTLIYIALRELAKRYESRNRNIYVDAGYRDPIGF